MKKFLIVLALAGALLTTMVTSGFATPAKSITVTWSEDSTSVDVTSDKALSNVVLQDCLGIQYKYDNLKSHEGTFEHPSGLAITTVWVKSGNNSSGDGPGYGERFDNPNNAACNETIPCEADNSCETTTTTIPKETTTTTVPEKSTVTTVVETIVAAPKTLTAPPAPPAASAVPVAPAPAALPRTGSSTGPLVLAGTLALALGGTAFLGRRRIACR